MRTPLLSAALMLSAAGLPAAQSQSDDAQRYYYEEIFEPFFVKDEAAGVYRSRRRGALETSFPIRKSSDTFRVFLLGGSIARMALEHEPRQDLREALQAALPAKRVEALNCGMAGYDSFREALIEQEILEYEPDLVVFFTGHNESLGSPPVPVWLLKAQERLREWAAYRTLAARLQARPWKPQGDPEEAIRRRDAGFRENLRKNFRAARERGVAVVTIVPPVNLRDGPTTHPRPALNTAFMRGWAASLRGDCAGAVKRWREALSGMDGAFTPESNRSLTLWHIARCEERLGRLKPARRAYEEASAADVRAMVCGPRCRQALREAAREEGAALADVDAAFRARAFPRLPGLDMFDDLMHWKRGWNYLVSLEVAEAAAADPALSGEPWDRKALAALRRRWEERRPAAPEAEETLRYALRTLAIVSSPEASPQPIVYLDAVYERRPEWFRDVPSLLARAAGEPELGKTWGMGAATPETARARWHVGEMLLARGRARAAAEELAAAAREDPALARAWLALAAAQAVAGDPAAARRSLGEAVGRAGTEEDRLLREAAVLSEALGLKSS